MKYKLIEPDINKLSNETYLIGDEFDIRYGDLVTLSDGFENIINNIDDLLDIAYNETYEIVKITRNGVIVYEKRIK